MCSISVLSLAPDSSIGAWWHVVFCVDKCVCLDYLSHLGRAVRIQPRFPSHKFLQSQAKRFRSVSGSVFTIGCPSSPRSIQDLVGS